MKKNIKSKSKQKKSTKKLIFKFTTRLLLLAILVLIVIGIAKYKDSVIEAYKDAIETVDASSEETFSPDSGTNIYDSDNELITTISNENKRFSYLEYDEIPNSVINSFVAIEDQTFWDNNGYDIKGIIRICYRYVITGGQEKHGASTITQQLAKNIFLTREVSLERKIKEIFMARELTDVYSKDDILEYYINNVCFANSIYGIEEAAQEYFGIPANELTISQAAYLCAIPNSPEYYNPWKDSSTALTRRDKIINDMYECGYISTAQKNAALKENISVIPKKTIDEGNETLSSVKDYQSSYAIKCAVEYLMELDNFNFQCEFNNEEDYKKYKEKYNAAYSLAKEDLYSNKYTIYTSLDTTAQSELQAKLDEVLEFSTDVDEKTGIYALQGSMTAIDNETGKVIAVIGGRTQEENSTGSLNRAFQSYRQPGSSIKPIIVYTPALLTGEYDADSSLQNINVTKANKTGTDVNKLTGSKMALRRAVEKSVNGCAYYLFNQMGVDYGMSFLPKLEFSKVLPADYSLSSALGGFTYGTNTAEMAGAYSTFTNEGNYRETTCITSVLDKNNKELYKEKEETKVYDAESVTKMTDILEGVISNGTARSLNWDSDKIAAAGKTGTTNDNKDGWFCGYTPYYTISVWIGYDTPKTLNSLQGASYPAKIWKEAMSYLTQDKEDAQFEEYNSYKALTDWSGVSSKEKEEIEEEEKSGVYDTETYLPGMSPERVLSDGYTVADYRNDHVAGAQVDHYISMIQETTDETAKTDAYNKALYYIEQIKGTTYKNEVTSRLEMAMQ